MEHSGERKYRVLCEKKGGCSSAGCMVQRSKLQLSDEIRGGVPVFRRISLKFNFSSDSDNSFAAGRPSPPDSLPSFPIYIRPLRVVPDVTMTAFAEKSPLLTVVTPWIIGDGEGNTRSCKTESSIMVRLCCCSATRLIRYEYMALSH